MMTFHPKRLSQIKTTEVNKKPISKKPASTICQIPHKLQVQRVSYNHMKKNNKHFYIPQNDNFTPPLKIRESLNQCRGTETTTATPESATLNSWQWLNISAKSSELILINNHAAGQHLASSRQTIFTSLLSGHKLSVFIYWHTQSNCLPLTEACSALLES